MKEVGLIIDFCISPVSDEGAVKKAVSDFYVPFIRLLKTNKEMKVSLNIPLCTLELLDKYGYQDIILETREFYEKERVEIVGSSAYNALLTDFSKDTIESQVILNEYGLGYYLGSKQGFEGEPSIMLRGLDGFLSPALHINNEMLSALNEVGYKWVAVGEGYLKDASGNYNTPIGRVENRDLLIVGVVEDLNTKINNLEKEESDYNSSESEDFKYLREGVVNRIEELEKTGLNPIIFKIGNKIKSRTDENMYKEEMDTLGVLVECLIEKNISIKNVGEVIKNLNQKIASVDEKQIEEQGKQTPIFSVIYDEKDEIYSKLVDIEKLIDKDIKNTDIMPKDGHEMVIRMWNNDEVRNIVDDGLRNNVRKFILFSKFICMDKYYYAYNINSIIDSKYKSRESILVFIEYARGLSELINDNSTKDKLELEISNLILLLDA